MGALLREVSKLTGQTPAKLVREILTEAAPALAMMVEAGNLVKKRPEQAQAAIARFAMQAHHDLAQAQLDLDTAIKKKPGRKPTKKPGRGAAKGG